MVYGALGVVLLIMLLGGLLSSYSASCYREKASPYECGFEPIGSARSPFSLRFFVLAMLFLVFDAEVVLLFPVLEAFRTGAVSSRVVWDAAGFLIILILGLWYEWYEGSIEWMV